MACGGTGFSWRGSGVEDRLGDWWLVLTDRLPALKPLNETHAPDGHHLRGQGA